MLDRHLVAASQVFVLKLFEIGLSPEPVGTDNSDGTLLHEQCVTHVYKDPDMSTRQGPMAEPRANGTTTRTKMESERPKVNAGTIERTVLCDASQALKMSLQHFSVQHSADMEFCTPESHSALYHQ
jgi:hypothetical protein